MRNKEKPGVRRRAQKRSRRAQEMLGEHRTFQESPKEVRRAQDRLRRAQESLRRAQESLRGVKKRSKAKQIEAKQAVSYFSLSKSS